MYLWNSMCPIVNCGCLLYRPPLCDNPLLRCSGAADTQQWLSCATVLPTAANSFATGPISILWTSSAMEPKPIRIELSDFGCSFVWLGMGLFAVQFRTPMLYRSKHLRYRCTHSILPCGHRVLKCGFPCHLVANRALLLPDKCYCSCLLLTTSRNEWEVDH